MKLLILAFLLISNSSFARFATKEDLKYSRVFVDNKFFVKKDGTYKVIIEDKYKILKEEGKEKFKLFGVSYQSSISKFKLLDAFVENDGQILKVEMDKIAERSHAKDQGVDDLVDVQIPFPQVKLGSIIYLKYEIDVHKVLIPGHFSQSFMLDFGLTEQDTFTIESEIPLYYKIHDPRNTTTITSKNENGKFYISGALKQPNLHTIIEEQSILRVEDYFNLLVSSHDSWDTLGKGLKQNFDKVTLSKISPELKKVTQFASKLKSLEDKVNYVVAYITGNYNYLGDWRSLEGAFAPKSATDTSKTKYGDCKDFSTLLVMMLRDLKIKADVALVHRSSPVNARYFNYDLGSPSLFNHAIVRIEDSKGVYWVDPTNPASFGLNHRADISGKKTLVLGDEIKLEEIPAQKMESNYTIINKKITLRSSDSGDVETELVTGGDFAFFLTGLENRMTKSEIEKILMGFTSNGESGLLPEFSPYNLKTRQYKELKFKYKYSASGFTHKHDNETHFNLSDLTRFYGALTFDSEHWKGDVVGPEPQTIERNIMIENLPLAESPRGCFIDTPWASVKREFEILKNGLKIHEKMVFKQNLVHNRDLASTDLLMLQSTLSRCSRFNELVVNTESNQHVEHLHNFPDIFKDSPLEKRIESRVKLAREILDESYDGPYSIDEAIFLLKKNLEEVPNHPKSTQMLAAEITNNGYYNGDNYNSFSVMESLSLLENALKVHPDNIGLKIRSLNSKLKLGRVAEVKAELPSIEAAISSSKDFYDVSSLGHVYSGLGESEKQITLLQNVLPKLKNDLEKGDAHFALAAAFSDKNDNEKCVEHYEQTIKFKPLFTYPYININKCLNALGKFDKAIELARAGYKINSRGIINRVLAISLRKRGYDFMKQKKFDLAEVDFKESLHYENHADTYLALAAVSSNKGEFDRAANIILEGAKVEKDDPSDFIVRGAHSIKNSGIALGLYEKAIAMTQDPARKLNHYYMIMAIHMAKPQEFKNIFTKASETGEVLVKNHPDNPSVVMQLSTIYMMFAQATRDKQSIKRGKELCLMAQKFGGQTEGQAMGIYSQFERIEKSPINRMPASQVNGAKP